MGSYNPQDTSHQTAVIPSSPKNAGRVPTKQFDMVAYENKIRHQVTPFFNPHVYAGFSVTDIADYFGFGRSPTGLQQAEGVIAFGNHLPLTPDSVDALRLLNPHRLEGGASSPNQGFGDIPWGLAYLHQHPFGQHYRGDFNITDNIPILVMAAFLTTVGILASAGPAVGTVPAGEAAPATGGAAPIAGPVPVATPAPVAAPVGSAPVFGPPAPSGFDVFLQAIKPTLIKLGESILVGGVVSSAQRYLGKTGKAVTQLLSGNVGGFVDTITKEAPSSPTQGQFVFSGGGSGGGGGGGFGSGSLTKSSVMSPWLLFMIGATIVGVVYLFFRKR